MKCINRCLPVFFLLLIFGNAQAFHCSVTTNPVSFGSYDVFSPAPIDTIGAILVSCNNPEKKAMPVIISINRGNSGSFNPRQMWLASGSDHMNYYLFIDPSRTTIWGDGSGGTSTVTRTIEKTSPLNLPVYGRIPARQNLRVGAYSDQLVVTVNW